MIVKKGFLSLAAAAALAVAVTAAPQPAHAVVWWVAPAIVAGVVGGVAVGAAASNAAYANANGYYEPGYGPSGAVYVQPTPSCRWVHVERGGRMFRERICP
jgi:hypothetical protein